MAAHGRGASLAVSPETIERMFLADIQLLDVLYTATHDLLVETIPGGEPQCALHGECGQAFLPVRSPIVRLHQRNLVVNRVVRRLKWVA